MKASTQNRGLATARGTASPLPRPMLLPVWGQHDVPKVLFFKLLVRMDLFLSISISCLSTPKYKAKALI